MFLGEYRHSLDNKNRLIVPAKFRSELGESFVMTKGLDKCLFLFPMAEWSKLSERLRSLSMTQANARSFSRFFLAGAAEAVVDKQGRVLLPNNLREFAEVDKDVVVVGVANRVEIWSEQLWEDYSAVAEESYSEIAESLVDLGI